MVSVYPMLQNQQLAEKTYPVRLNPEQRRQTRFVLWANFFALLLNATLAVLFWKLGTGKPLTSLMSVFTSCLAIVFLGLYRKSTQVLTLTDRGLRYERLGRKPSLALDWSEIESARLERNFTYTWVRLRLKKSRFRRPIAVIPPEQAEEILQEIRQRIG